MTTRRALIKRASMGFLLMLIAPLRCIAGSKTLSTYEFSVTCQGNFPNFFASFNQDRTKFENTQAIIQLNKEFALNGSLLSFKEVIETNNVTWHYKFRNQSAFDLWNATISRANFFDRNKVPSKYLISTSVDVSSNASSLKS